MRAWGRRLPPGTFCYLCGKVIAEGEDWNRDHVPPQRLFAKSVRKQRAVQLDWLPTHNACNSAYASDEDYFVTALVGQHGTEWAKAVFADIRRGVARGQGVGLIKTILGQFGKVTTSDGTMLFALDANRANRAIWKIVRGLYTLETGRFVPDLSYLNIEIVPRSEADKTLPGHLWFESVRNTEGLGRHRRSSTTSGLAAMSMTATSMFSRAGATSWRCCSGMPSSCSACSMTRRAGAIAASQTNQVFRRSPFAAGAGPPAGRASGRAGCRPSIYRSHAFVAKSEPGLQTADLLV
jgi:hypothetical protein